MDNTNEVMTFTCKDCGSNKLLVLDKYWTTKKFERVDKKNLKIYQGRLIEEWERVGELGDDHRVTWDYRTERGAVEEEIDDWNNIDESELHNYGKTNIYQKPIIDQESREVFVLCWGCKRDIEFGWSRENRRGRIWPVESSDFNPRKKWPEPRYKESWSEKGWLMP